MKPQHNAEPGLCSSSPALCPVPTKPWHFLSFHLLVFVTWGPQSSDRNRSADPHPPRVGQRASADTPLGPVFQTQRGDSIRKPPCPCWLPGQLEVRVLVLSAAQRMAFLVFFH